MKDNRESEPKRFRTGVVSVSPGTLGRPEAPGHTQLSLAAGPTRPGHSTLTLSRPPHGQR